MNVLGIDIDRSGRVWTSSGDTIYSKNPYYIYLSLLRFIKDNGITHLCIEDINTWSHEFRSQNGKLISVLKMIIHKQSIKEVCEIVMVDSHGTSMTCSKCLMSDKRSRPYKSLFHCVYCGYKTNADRNAAKNILYRGLKIINDGNN